MTVLAVFRGVPGITEPWAGRDVTVDPSRSAGRLATELNTQIFYPGVLDRRVRLATGQLIQPRQLRSGGRSHHRQSDRNRAPRRRLGDLE
jgi:hypothetical protein